MSQITGKTQLFVQQLVPLNNKGNINDLHQLSFVIGTTSGPWIPLQGSCYVENFSRSWRPHDIKPKGPIMRSCYDFFAASMNKMLNNQYTGQ